MTKEQYQAIRNKPNFLFLYFINSGGVGVQERSFAQFLSLWLVTKQKDPARGIAEIVAYLDSINRS